MRPLVLMMTTVMLVAALAAGDEPEPAPVGGLGFADQVQVTVVNVDVFVRDHDGRPVTGLGKDDFLVRQDGIEMPVTNFAVLTQQVMEHTLAAKPLAEPALAAPQAPQAPRIRPAYVVLFIDNENLHPLQRNRVLRSVRSFVLEAMHGPVQIMVVSYQRSLKVLQPFTDDPPSVTDALRGLVRASGGAEDRDAERNRIVQHIQEAKSGEDTGDAASRNARYGLSNEIMNYAKEEAANVSDTLSALRQVVAVMSGLSGRKAVVYVSSGLPLTPGLGLMHDYAMAFRDSAILTRRSEVDRTRDFHSLAAAANGQEVSLYTIDASGLNPLEGFGADTRYSRDLTASSIGMKNFQESLQYLADATGGLAVINANDVGPGLEKVREDLFAYYSLGYTISATGDDRVHRISVELPNHPQYDLRYRRRFVEKSLESAVQDRVLSSLLVDLDDNPMGIELEPGSTVPAAGDRWTVPLHVSFPLSSIAMVPEGQDYVGRVALIFGARDADGGQSDLQRQEHEVRVPESDYDLVKGRRYGFDLDLLLEKGRQRVAVGLMDRVTRQASYQRLSLTVP